MVIKIPRKGYTDERLVFKHGHIDINPGITILIGCNGSGKTTILREIREKSTVPVYYYDNLTIDGKNKAFSSGNYALLNSLYCSSEGESIILNLMNSAQDVIHLIKYGERKKGRLEKAFDDIFNSEENDSEKSIPKERILLFDAIDSGLSIDQVQDLKNYFFKSILNSYDKDKLYIIVSANEYELCKDYPCFNVTEGKYVDISSYEDYSKEIFKTRKYKDKQIQKLEEKENNGGNS